MPKKKNEVVVKKEEAVEEVDVVSAEEVAVAEAEADVAVAKESLAEANVELEAKKAEEAKAAAKAKVLVPLTNDFGRADLNTLRDTVNDLIAKQ